MSLITAASIKDMDDSRSGSSRVDVIEVVKLIAKHNFILDQDLQISATKKTYFCTWQSHLLTQGLNWNRHYWLNCNCGQAVFIFNFHTLHLQPCRIAHRATTPTYTVPLPRHPIRSSVLDTLPPHQTMVKRYTIHHPH